MLVAPPSHRETGKHAHDGLTGLAAAGRELERPGRHGAQRGMNLTPLYRGAMDNNQSCLEIVHS